MTERELLLEIGCEELPARFIAPALEQLRLGAATLLGEAHLSYDSIETYATPRRLVLVVSNLPERQPDRSYAVTGPGAAAAYDSAGEPTKALLGFVAGRGGRVEDVTLIDGPKGKVVSLAITETGKPTGEVLPALLEKLVSGLTFPKSMFWISGSKFRFGRPLRWLCCIYNREHLPFSVAGIASGDWSFGHRFISPGRFKCADFENYRMQLNQRSVILKPELRRKAIAEGTAKIAETYLAKPLLDEKLLEELVNLVERPLVLEGSFDESFLELPACVLVASLKGHQRFVPLQAPDGRLLNRFAFVSNNLNDDRGVIRKGNESFLRSRLDDALFFFRDDVKTPLIELLDKLKAVTWHVKLGSMWEKVQRLHKLVRLLAENLKNSIAASSVEHAERAALLCKNDLVTHMVYEFPELQGQMGSLYARRSSELPAVATAIEEHYLPRFKEDGLPTATEGILLSLADKLDSLVGIFATGYQPKGNEDPFALRRQVLGILRILQEHGLRLDLPAFLPQVAAQFAGKVETLPADLAQRVLGFIWDRLRNDLVGEGVPADVIEAIFCGECRDAVDVRNRVLALQRLSSDRAAFEPVILALKRVIRIIPEGYAVGSVQAGLLADTAEKALWDEYQQRLPALEAALAAEAYSDFLSQVVALKPAIDTFFDAVMVNVEEEAVRQNRLNLLAAVGGTFKRLADFTKLAG